MAIFPFFGSGGGQVDAGYLQRVLLGNMASTPPEEWTAEMWAIARQPGQLEQITGSTYDQVKEKDPQVVAQRQQEQQQSLAQQIAQAQATNAPPPPPPEAPPPSPPPPEAPPGPTPEEQRAQLRSSSLAGLESLLPSGFESSYVPGTVTDPFEQSTLTGQRSEADKFIANLVNRGLITETGRARGVLALGSQEPSARSRLDQLGQLLIEGERAGLRGVRETGRTAAGGLELGQTFDPETYRSQAQQRAGAFTAGLPTTYAAQAPTNLFDVSGLEGVTGAAVGPRNIQFDPYASTVGTEAYKTDEEAPQDVPRARRRTSVF